MDEPTDATNGEPSTAEIETTRGLPLVWLIPLVALLIGVWLAYKTLSAEGPTIIIDFKEAPGLEAGKSKVKFKDVEVGLVESVKLNEDLSGVTVSVKMEKSVAAHLGAGTAFWVVKPQLGLSGVSGLDTLMAGNYLAVEFVDGKITHHFTGLEQPPRISAETPGRSFVLMVDTASNLKYGTPVYFRGIPVGQVVDVALSEDQHTIAAEIFVNAPYDHLVRKSSRFWQTAGLDFSMGAQGFDLKVGSLLTLLGGGIEFDSPNLNDPANEPSAPATRFRLHKDAAAVADGSYTVRQPFLLHFDDSVRGLNVGAPVEVKGIRIGTVTDVRLDIDFSTSKIRIPVVIEIDPERLIPLGANEALHEFLQQHQQDITAGRRPVLEKMIERGLRARLKTGSLLTGQLFVDLDFYPKEAPARIVYGGQFPEIPTLPTLASELQKDASELIANLKKIPLDRIGQELLGTVQGTNRLANSAEIRAALRSLDLALKDIHQLAQNTDRQIAQLGAGVEKSLSATHKVLEQLEPGAPMSVDIGNALEELAASARSLRALTDYLERHPEALVRGKGGYGGK